MNQEQEFQFEGQAEELVSKYIDANSVHISTVKEVQFMEQYNRLNFVLENDKEQTGKGSFSLSEKAFSYVLALVASIANKSGNGSKMAAAFPNGKCEGCSREEWVNKVSSVIQGAKAAFLFGGRQSKGNWYAELQLFGSVGEPTEKGVELLETRRAKLQEDDRFMKKEVVPSTEVSSEEKVDY